jgi:hypothetical protein
MNKQVNTAGGNKNLFRKKPNLLHQPSSREVKAKEGRPEFRRE